jgi:RHS repeat-associated protein
MPTTDSRSWWSASGASGAPDRDAPTQDSSKNAAAATGTGPATTGSLPSISLPKGGGAIRGIDEKLTVNQATGTASLTVGVFTTPARQGFGPNLSLSYNSGSGNGPFGLGWNLGTPAITRKTSKGLPRYSEDLNSDVFVLSGAEDLVPMLDKKGATWTPRSTHRHLQGHTFEVRAYRPRVEVGFARIERWTDTTSGESHWRTTSTGNVTNIYGRGPTSRIADPADPSRVFSWLLDLSCDDHGNAIRYVYKPEDRANVTLTASEAHRTDTSNRYLKRILYGNDTPYLPATQEYSALPTDWCFELVLDYGEHDWTSPTPAEDTTWACRPDPFSTYRSCFEIRTYRLCRRLLMFHRMSELGEDPVLVRSTDLTHTSAGFEGTGTPVLSLLASITQTGWIGDGADGYTTEQLPPLSLGYSPLALDDTLHSPTDPEAANVTGVPDGKAQRWVDLNGEGLHGILTSGDSAWYYQANLSAWNPTGGAAEARFAPTALVTTKPSSGAATLTDLNGDGNLCAVDFTQHPGWFEYDPDVGWSPLRLLCTTAHLDFTDPNLRFVDLNGDGLSDVLITEDQVFTWYPWQVNEGFSDPGRVFNGFDEDLGPALVFADGIQSIHLADMTGDGLTDLVRVRNGEVCYWPNLGFGKFGAKVSMDNAPLFDKPDLFNERLITFADIDGSGTADLAYLGAHPTIWFNQSGNSWTAGHTLAQFPIITPGNGLQASVFDLLGTGTACAVVTSSLPHDATVPLRYVDLTAGTKPYLLTTITNNLGAQHCLTYAPSTKFYLQDRAAGTPWATRLPFPVHVVEKTCVDDAISDTTYTCSYTYHHGYYDGVEREFRGFARVDTLDTDTLPADRGIGGANSPSQSDGMAERFDLPPVHTRTWHHTGAYVDGVDTTALLKDEYWAGDSEAPDLQPTIMPDGAAPEEMREACRALRGRVLRQEVYTIDGSAEATNPYTTIQSRYQVDLLQPAAPSTAGYAAFYPDVYGCFHAWNRETLTCQYERNPADPRISHELTLTIDRYGNVTSRASIGYPRRSPAFIEQATAWVSYREADYTNVPDQPHWYRIGVPVETRSYQITGATITLPTGLFDPDTFNTIIAAAADIPYEATPTAGLQRRLLTRNRNYYRPDNLTAGPLPIGQIDSLALVHATYTQRYTPGLLTRVLGSKLTPAVQRSLTNACALIDLDNDGNLWSASARLIYSPDPTTADPRYAQTHFYQPVGAVDPWNNLSTVTYDTHNLLVTQTHDAAGNLTIADSNYRVLGPWLTTDANHNRNGVRYDALGMVTATAAMGKLHPGNTDEGDHLDLTTTETSPADRPTTTVDYHLATYMDWAATNSTPDHPCPVFVRTRARIEHHNPNTRWIETYSYTDGFGRLALTKAEAEPGAAPQRDTNTGQLIRDTNTALIYADTQTRWVGTGRIIYDNKNNPVKSYEPFFDSSPAYTDETDLVDYGVTAINRYDPLSRIVRVDNPDGTYRTTEFDPWQRITSDENDSVLDSDWYAARSGGQLGAAEACAATKAAAHANTPTVANYDTLGRTFQAVADNGAGHGYATTLTYDIQGRPLAALDALGRTVLTCDYDMTGAEIHHHSVEAGERWQLTDAGGQLFQTWDGRGNTVTASYDVLRRPTALEVTDNKGVARLAERIVYGETLSDAETLNLRGAPYQHFDEAGVATIASRDFKYNILTATRRLLIDYIDNVDWSSNPELAGPEETFTTANTYDALNRITTTIAPDASVTTPIYNQRGLPAAVAVNLQGGPTTTKVLTAATYNAKAQRETATYGNGVTATSTYDPYTFRLTSIRTSRPTQTDTLAARIFGYPGTVQDVHYIYDPVGNIVLAEDTALRTIIYHNRIAAPTNEYTYDPIYRLAKASGREHISRTLPQPTWDDAARTHLPASDIQAMQPYAEIYTYDPVGNFRTVTHQADAGSWTRTYAYDEPNHQPANNRLTSTNIGATTETYTYDVDGNITAMPHLSSMQWDWKDQLHASAKQVVNSGTPETTYYTYDSAGQRITKATNNQTGTRTAQRIYLGGYEIYREYDITGSITTERHSVHVGGESTRMCLIETTTINTKSRASVPNTVARYQFGNNIGSSAVELDATAALISYEEYYPYGGTSLQTGPNQAEVSLKRYRYTGKERDTENGFTYHGARYYAPWLGRWISCDPAGFVDSVNLYQYALLNPINNSDQSGMDINSDAYSSNSLNDPVVIGGAENWIQDINGHKQNPSMYDMPLTIENSDDPEPTEPPKPVPKPAPHKAPPPKPKPTPPPPTLTPLTPDPAPTSEQPSAFDRFASGFEEGFFTGVVTGAVGAAVIAVAGPEIAVAMALYGAFKLGEAAVELYQGTDEEGKPIDRATFAGNLVGGIVGSAVGGGLAQGALKGPQLTSPPGGGSGGGGQLPPPPGGGAAGGGGGGRLFPGLTDAEVDAAFSKMQSGPHYRTPVEISETPGRTDLGDLVPVSRWGRPGLRPGDWVMPGDPTLVNYGLSFKWEPTPYNEVAGRASGQAFMVPKSSIRWPSGWESFKGLFGQRQYKP